MSDTKEIIEGRILNRIPANIDKTEGEVTQTTVAPLSVELEQVYASIDNALDEIFPDTQSRPFLERDAWIRRGLAPFPATFAVVGGMFTGTFNRDALVGERFFSNDISFIVTRQLTDDEIAAIEGVKYNFELTSEVAGQRGNQNSGILVPFQYISGLETATLVAILSQGTDEEETEAFRRRYIDYLTGAAWGGNKLDYYYKLSQFVGYGRVKVFRAEDRGGYFDILFLSGDGEVFELPSQSEIERLQEIVDPSDNPGGGDGIAGIGQKPIVKSPDAVTININIGNIVFKPSESQRWEDHAAAITATVDAYLLELRKTFFETEQQTVFLSQIINRIGDMGAVLDIYNVTMNGTDRNIILLPKEVPFIGVVTN